ncbi:MAG: histidine kinase dimerization/phospho-acceptor domain-containing protein [bacterium]
METIRDAMVSGRLNDGPDQIQKDKIIAHAMDLAHELNQPLTGISGLVSLILEEIDESDIHYENLKEIEKQANRLQSMIQMFQNLL